MRSSETIDKLAAALHAAFSDLPNPHNDAANPHFKSRFVSLEALINWIRPRLLDNGLRLSQPARYADGKVGAAVRWYHGPSGQWLEEGECLLPFKGDDPQRALAAITYARRGGLMSALGIAGTDDDDGETAAGRGRGAPQGEGSPVGPGSRKAEAASSPGRPPDESSSRMTLTERTEAAIRDYLDNATNRTALREVIEGAQKDVKAKRLNKAQYDILHAHAAGLAEGMTE